MLRKLISLLLCTLILSAGAAVVFFATRNAENQALNAADNAPEDPPRNVEIQVLEPTTVEDVLLLTGRLEPQDDIVLAAEAMGVIEEQRVEEEQRVDAGDVLFKIDTESIRARIAEARARFTLADQELKRMRQMSDRGISSPQALDQASAEQSMARAALNSAEIQLEKSVITAPIAGVITDLYRKNGEFVDIGTDLCRLLNIDEMRVIIPLPERDFSLFKRGSLVTLTVDALPDREFQGEIYRLNTSSDRATRTFVAEVKLANPEGVLKPGMTVRARLVRNHFDNAVTIPLFAIIALENQRFVYLEDNGKALFREISVGRIHGDRVHVTEGLSPGDRLIIKGQRELRDGQSVQSVPGDAA